MEGKGLSPFATIILLLVLTIGVSVVIEHYYSKYVEQQYRCDSDICIMCKGDVCGAFLENTTMPEWETVSKCDIVCNESCSVNCTLVKSVKIPGNLQISGLVLNITEFYNLTG